MTESFSNLFQYLEKERIYIDKTEFEFQIQSHPDYPSLLAISDTLSFFNIENLSAKIDKTQIEILPNRYIALFAEDFGNPQFHIIEKEKEDYFLVRERGRILISKKKLEEGWGEIVLLVEKSIFEDVSTKNKENYNWFLFGIIAILFLFFLYSSKTVLPIYLFFLFSAIGVLFSIAALKDLLGTKSKLINNFCNITKSTSCASVVDSKKWKIFEVINFSDLSIVFFSSQLIALFLLTLNNKVASFFSLEKIFLLSSIPFILTSIYYQKFVEKKWCPICLAIILIILTELVFVFFIDFGFVFLLDASLLFFFSFVFTLAIWGQIKKVLNKQKELRGKLLKAIRFERNYENFKNNLLVKPKIILSNTPIILGNAESETIITIISNPFCSYCKEAHEIIESILEKHYNDLQVRIILKTNFEDENEDNRKLFRSLIHIYMLNGEKIFMQALKNWFENKNLKNWFGLFSVDTTDEFDTIFYSQNKWCQDNDYNFTPAIFINGYEYPQAYSRENLIFFIDEVIEDNF
ncbi:vitamin K epoxide reductase family protein [Flavobacterium collinsii]|uniref:Vitamin K epoxide reductase domain-containing protein n=1 Tax=Flavobacterium collinsii TaxID=1114861 RepID=A0ABN7ER17_9FLAO|nr:vitamin K epoxide reductase family protein [Flavobacterium collinsii]CAA9200803.1 hypothetical protein FLACOL7796_03442 [Flavobacterium collinsii]